MRTQSIAFAQHDSKKWHFQFSRHDKHAAGVPHLRLGLNFGADHEAGGVGQRHQGQAVRIAQLHEAAGFVCGVGVDGAAQMQRIVGHDAHGAAFDARQCRQNADAKVGAQFEHGFAIAQRVHHAAHVVHAQPVLRHGEAQLALVIASPVGRSPLKIREVLACGVDCIDFIFHQNIDHAIARLHIAGADVFGGVLAEATTFDHGRATHANIARLRGNDHVAAAEQRRVACKATPMHDADHGHPA